MGSDDSPDLHFRDTVLGGKYLNNQLMVRILVDNAPRAIRKLESEGVMFVRDEPQRLRQTRPGGGSVNRGLHVKRNDRVMRIVWERAAALGVKLRDQMMVTRLLSGGEGRIEGAVALDILHGRVVWIRAQAVILAAGAGARLFQRTATTRNATGDGFALAMDLGLPMEDMEFVQFIPTGFVASFIDGMTLGEGSVWGTGVKFLNAQGERYLDKYAPGVPEHRATRDILARANYMEVLEGRGTEHRAILIDPTASDPQEVEFQPHTMAHRYRLIRDFYGPDVAALKRPLEASPSALYFCGGVSVDTACRTPLPGLYACGEVMAGVHGANRLNGNSLIDLEVFGRIAAESACEDIRHLSNEVSPHSFELAEIEANRLHALRARDGRGIRPRVLKERIQDTMWNRVGIVRNRAGIEAALEDLREIEEQIPAMRVTGSHRRYNLDWVEGIEVPNMLRVAKTVAQAALNREETRGNQFRQDFPDTDNQGWLNHSVSRWAGDRLAIEYRPVELIEMWPSESATARGEGRA